MIKKINLNHFRESNPTGFIHNNFLKSRIHFTRFPFLTQAYEVKRIETPLNIFYLRSFNISHYLFCFFMIIYAFFFNQEKRFLWVLMNMLEKIVTHF